MEVVEVIKEPWPWYVAGPIIAFVYIILKYFGKSFGVSATLRDQCTILGAGKRVGFFKFNWKNDIWNLVFVLGTMLGGFLAVQFLSTGDPMAISESTQAALIDLGINSHSTGVIEPTEIFDISNIAYTKVIFYILSAGFLVGFGSRYAGGCTSGHAISGLANLQISSLIAVIGFFIGGMIMVWFILPEIIPFFINN